MILQPSSQLTFPPGGVQVLGGAGGGAAPYWLMDTTTRVQYGGLATASFGNVTQITNGSTYITGGNNRIRQFGYIRRATAYFAAIGGTIKFKVFRANGANFDFVGESEAFTPSGTGSRTFNFTTPIPCQPGDWVGCYLEGASISVGCANGATGTLRSASGDISATDAFSGSSAYYADIVGLGISPYFLAQGDSICEGYNLWASHYSGGPGGTLANEPWNQMRNAINNQQLDGFEYQNFGRASSQYSWVASKIGEGLDTGAKVIFVHCGINDVFAGNTWATVEGHLNTIKGLFAASSSAIKLLIDEILPSTGATNVQAATVRTFNTNLAAWVAANNDISGKTVQLVVCHDAMGQIRAATGELDDLLTAYSLDGTHLNATGNGAWAGIIKPYVLT